MPHLRDLGAFAWRTINRFFDDGCPGMAAALAFYTFFSLPALLLLLFVLLGVLLDPEEIHGALGHEVESLVGPAAAEQVRNVLLQLSADEGRAARVTFFGAATLIFGATTAFAELQGALNRIWKVEPDPSRGSIRNFLTKRIFSFGIVLALAFFLLVSLVLSTTLAVIGDRIAAALPGDWSGWGLQVLDFAISFLLVALIFGAMFRLLPDAQVTWREVRVGAFATALLFVGGRLVIGLYLGGTDPGDAYGGAGSLAVLLIWVYYSSMIVYLGAELTREWQDTYGGGVRPAPGAVEVVREKRPVS
jgi:membrane protein